MIPLGLELTPEGAGIGLGGSNVDVFDFGARLSVVISGEDSGHDPGCR